MADKIVQVEEFCTHSKILGKYQIRSDKHKLLKVNWMFSSNFLIDDFLKSYSSYSKGCIAFFWLIVVEIDKKIRFHKILGLEHFAGNIIAAFLWHSEHSELDSLVQSFQVLLYSDRLSAWGLGSVQSPEQGPGEADAQHPGRDQGQAHQVQQHQDSDWSILIT